MTVILWCVGGYVTVAILGALALGRAIKLADSRPVHVDRLADVPNAPAGRWTK